MTDREFKVGTTIKLESGPYTFVGLHGGVMLLRSSLDGTLLNLHVSEVHRRLAEPVESFQEQLRAHENLSNLTAEQQKTVQDRLKLVQQVINGKSDEDEDYSEGYDPSVTTQTERMNRRASEPVVGGVNVPRATLKNWVYGYKRIGVAALVDKRWLRESAALPRVDSKVFNAAVATIAATTDRSTVTETALLTRIKEYVLRDHVGEEVSMPGDRTLRTLIQGLSQGKYPTGSAKNRRSAANAPQRMFDPRPAWFPGQEFQLDESPFDVRVRGYDAQPTTAKLVIAIDKATHSIGANAVAHDIDGEVLAFMLAEMSIPRSSRPEAPRAFNELELDELECARGLDLVTSQAAARLRPYIRPVRIMTDLGPAFTSATLRYGCHHLGTSITRAAVGTPTDKGIVERAFHSIKTMFVDYLPGYTGGSVENRAIDPDSENLIGIETLALLFDRWVDVVWQNLPSQALRDPEFPQVLHSPNSMYEALFRFVGSVPIPLTEADYVSLLPSKQLSIQRDGVTMEYRRYDAPALNPFRKRVSSRATPKYRVHYRLHDPSQVWVYIPDSHQYIPCPWRNQDAFAHPFSRAAREIATMLDGGIRSTSDERNAASAAFIKRVLAAAQREEGKASKASAERRLAEAQGRKLRNPATAMVEVPQPEDMATPAVTTNEYFPSIHPVVEDK